MRSGILMPEVGTSSSSLKTIVKLGRTIAILVAGRRVEKDKHSCQFRDREFQVVTG